MTQPIALAPGLDPSDYTSLESFAAHVQELILHLRDEGHVLSSVDQHFIERWWAAGYPLEVVLASVLEGGRKLMARKNKPRGLPLKSLHKRVEKAGGRALERGVGLDESAQSPSPSDSLAERLLRQLEAAIETEPTPPRAAAVEALGHLVESPDGAPTFAACLAVSRAYYDALLLALSPDEAERLRRQSIETLGDAAKRMTPEGLGETVEELARRSLRQQDSLLDPTGWVAGL
jgi:hypothetical protein